jgi:hypothetical protein
MVMSRGVFHRAFFQRGAHAHVDHDLFQARNLVDVAVLALLAQGGPHFVDVFFVKSGFHFFGSGGFRLRFGGGAAPRLAARASNFSASITLEMWIVPSRSMMAPCGLLLVLAVCA